MSRAVRLGWHGGRRRQQPAKLATIGYLGATTPRTPFLAPPPFAVAGDPVGTGLVASSARPAAMLPACRSRQLIWLASGLKPCARLSPISAGWRSWAMSAAQVPVLEMHDVQATAPTLGLEVATSEIRRAEDIAPAFDALKDLADALYVVC